MWFSQSQDRVPWIPQIVVGFLTVLSVVAIMTGISVTWASAQEREISVPVEGFRFSGHTAFPGETLESVVADLAGRQLTLAELEAAAQRITQFYRERGFLVAQAYLPAQEIADGMVEIAVLEGRYDRVILRNSSRLVDDAARKVLGRVTPGALIEECSLERSLRLLSEIPGVSVRSSLSAGNDPGTSDLTVEIHDVNRFAGRFVVDNYGNELTGRLRSSASAVFNNPRGWGDRFDVQLVTTGVGMTHGRVEYSMPLTFSSLRLSGSYSTSVYELGGPFAAIGADGTMDIWTASLTYPYRRIAPRLAMNSPLFHHIDLKLNFEKRDLENRVAGLGGARHMRSLVFAVDGIGRDFGTSVHATLRMTVGNLNIPDPVERLLDELSAQTAGNYVKLEGHLLEQRTVGQDMTLQLDVKWQWASKNLHNSEKLALGGSHGVRAYGPGEASGDVGLLARLELQKQAYRPGFRWIGFFDGGAVQVNQKSWDSTPNSRLRFGLGVGMVYSSGTFDLKAEYALPVWNSQSHIGRWGVQAGIRW